MVRSTLGGSKVNEKQYGIKYKYFSFISDKSRENYRDAICTVMRQLLRKNLAFVAQTQAVVTSILAESYTLFYCPPLAFLFFPLQITSWNTQKMIQSLSSLLSRWVRYFKIFNYESWICAVSFALIYFSNT